MSERDLSQADEEQEKESLERGETKKDSSGLEEITRSPESHLETTVEYKDSEKVEKVFVDVIGTDKKVDQIEQPGTLKEDLESSGKGKTGRDPVTPITPSSPESKAGSRGEKSEPDSKVGAVGVDSSPKTESIEKSEEETTPEKLEATPITLPDKEGAKATPSKPDEIVAEKPEQMRKGVEKEANLADGIDGFGVEIPSIAGLPEDDPFGQGGMGPDVDIGGEGEKDLSGIAPDFQETIKQAQGDQKPSDPGTIGGGPGSVHPNYGASGQGMVSEPVKPKTPSGGQDSGGDQGGTQPNGKSKTKSQSKTKTSTSTGGTSSEDVRRMEVEIMRLEALLGKRADNWEKFPSRDNRNKVIGVSTALGSLYDKYHEATGYVLKRHEKMPRPDEEESGVEAPQSEEDIKREDMVVDPASFQGVTPSSGVSQTKHPGLVSDPAEPQGPDTPDGGIKTDRDLTTDPPGEELGKQRRKKEK